MDNFQGHELDHNERVESVLLLHNNTTPIAANATWPYSPLPVTPFDLDGQMQMDTTASPFDWNTWEGSSSVLEGQHSNHMVDLRPTVSLPLRPGYTDEPRESSEAIYRPALENMANNLALARWADIMNTGEDQREAHHRYSVCDFFGKWAFQYKWESQYNSPRIGDHAFQLREVSRPECITVLDLKGDCCDIQGINWQELQASRCEARSIRNHSYIETYHLTSFQKVSALRRGKLELPCEDVNYRFRQLKTRCQPRFYHRYLRSIVAAPTRNSVFYANASKIDCYDPSFDTIRCVADLSKAKQAGLLPVGISALAAENEVLVVGECDGEYALKRLDSENNGTFTTGNTSKQILNPNMRMVNHIHTFLDRRSGLPQAVFSSNDSVVRVLDCHTNSFVQEHRTKWAVNCSTTSPDSRLRLFVGDNNQPMVIEAESGKKVTHLRAHSDYGFACDWAPDGIHMATGHEDGVVAVWDARFWDRPYRMFETEIGGARSLRFSPLGGGRRALLVAEPADIVSVVDAVTFESRQRFDFFGEIGGVAFSPDGGSFFVANTDDVFGGIMEFERTGCRYGSGVMRQERLVGSGKNAEKMLVETYNDWTCEDALDDEDRISLESRRRYRSWNSEREMI